MHHKDYELAERCLQDLREGRLKRWRAEDVQKLAAEITMDKHEPAPIRR
jgi:hypothetical protein